MVVKNLLLRTGLRMGLVLLLAVVVMPQAGFAMENNQTSKKAMDIQKVTTPSGITAWLVESHSLPMVSVQVAFRAGSAFDPTDKSGVANLTAGLLTQGAGDLSAEAFQKEKERLGASLSASAGKLNITAGFDALTEVTDETFALFAKALKNPTFDKTDFKRLQKAVIASRKRVTENPRQVAQEAFAEVVYGRYHPYSRPTQGTLRAVKKLKTGDVRQFHEQMFTRANMVVSVVGDITPDGLAVLLEKHLGDLPAGSNRQAVERAPKDQPPVRRVIEQDIPQTTVVMGHEGLNRSAPDYFAALVTNHILGGGGFSSQLMQEVREKRGLVYGISSYFNPLPHRGAFRVIAQTKNESVGEVINLVKKQIREMRQNGVTKEDYDAAISYLVGSFPLRLDSNSDILSYLTFMQTEQLGMDYMNNWVNNIKAVRRADIKATARKRLKPDEMAIVLVGKPGEKTPAPAPQKTAPAAQAPEPEAQERAPEKSAPTPAAPTPPPEPETASTPETPSPEPASQQAPIAPAPVEEESVAAPVKKAPETQPQQRRSNSRAVKPRRIPQPTRPENPERRNPESESWL